MRSWARRHAHSTGLLRTSADCVDHFCNEPNGLSCEAASARELFALGRPFRARVLAHEGIGGNRVSSALCPIWPGAPDRLESPSMPSAFGAHAACLLAPQCDVAELRVVAGSGGAGMDKSNLLSALGAVVGAVTRKKTAWPRPQPPYNALLAAPRMSTARRCLPRFERPHPVRRGARRTPCAVALCKTVVLSAAVRAGS